MKVLTGLERLVTDHDLSQKLSGTIGYLCHQSSVDSRFNHGTVHFKALFKDRFKKIFSPQHGLVGDMQDNMVESKHFYHPYFDLPVYSLYSETRIPTDEMLTGLDHMVVDLQDVGTRIYTFISTMMYMMEACGKKGIEVVILDRPNPIGGEEVEGNILESKFSSFVGLYPMPTRHGMTIGEVAKWGQKYCGIACELRVIPMQGWNRKSFFEETELPWVPPSPNMPFVDSTFPFVGTVLFEGAQISEGRGTTRPLEIVGHPQFDPWEHLDKIRELTKELEGFVLRPCFFRPTFHKYTGTTCGGYHIHVTARQAFRPWRLAQLLCQYFHHNIEGLAWKTHPYEYEYDRLPIDLINGTDRLRKWVEEKRGLPELELIEQKDFQNYMENKKMIEFY